MPLVRVDKVCKTIAIPGKFNPETGQHGKPVAAELCTTPKNTMVEVPEGTLDEPREESHCMCTKYPDLVCPSTADAIKLANPTQLLTFAVGGLTTLTVDLADLPLWHSVRLAYFATSGIASPDGLTVTLTISGIDQVGPLLGGEMSSTNANACAIWNCAVGRVMGPNENASITVASTGAAFPAGATVTVRVAYFYNPSVQFEADAKACESGTNCASGACGSPIG